jgi:hypothetical protein
VANGDEEPGSERGLLEAGEVLDADGLGELVAGLHAAVVGVLVLRRDDRREAGVLEAPQHLVPRAPVTPGDRVQRPGPEHRRGCDAIGVCGVVVGERLAPVVDHRLVHRITARVGGQRRCAHEGARLLDQCFRLGRQLEHVLVRLPDMTEAVIVEAVRTPIGKRNGGGGCRSSIPPRSSGRR